MGHSRLILLALGLAAPAGLAAQQHTHDHAKAAPATRDTVTGVLVGIDTLKAGGMKHAMPAMKHEMPGMKHDSSATGHDMAGMKHEMPMTGGMGGMNHEECHKMMTDGGGGLALRLQIGSDTVSAHLGPIWYLKQQNPNGFSVGDKVAIDGVTMTHDGSTHRMAYAVLRGGQDIVLRDADGKPRWAAAMMARMKTKSPGQ